MKSINILLKSIREGITPALYIGHATDFGRLGEIDILAHFEKLMELPLADNLKSLGFEDKQQTVMLHAIGSSWQKISRPPPVKSIVWKQAMTSAMKLWVYP